MVELDDLKVLICPSCGGHSYSYLSLFIRLAEIYRQSEIKNPVIRPRRGQDARDHAMMELPHFMREGSK
ncbi:hypothetical protein QYF61_008107, partial [Mycteria americana]